MHRGKTAWMIGSALWIVLIFYASSSSAEAYCDALYDRVLIWMNGPVLEPDTGPPPDRFWIKKAVHLILFVTLSYFLSHCLGGSDWKKKIYRITLLGAVIGVSSEMVQLIFPGREPAFRDVLINAGSTLMGGLAFIRTKVW